jgi:nitric oxide reductase NorF protein
MIHRTSRQLARSFAALAILVLAGTAVVTAACLMLLFALLKSRRVIDDFLGFREERGLLRTALLAWPAIFAAAALLRAFLQGILSL